MAEAAFNDIESWATWLFLLIAWTLASFLVGSVMGRAARQDEPRTHGDDGGCPRPLPDEVWPAVQPKRKRRVS